MLKQVVGFSQNLMMAKTRAAFFFNQLEVRTRLEQIESQIGLNELGEQAWFTTIWYTELPDPVTPVQEEKHEFIGSTDIDPNDPDWWNKMYGNQVAESDSLEVLEETSS